MAKDDIIRKWSGTISFALSTTSPRRLRLSEDSAGLQTDIHGQRIWDYVEVDNRGNKGATIYYAFNGTLATATLATGIHDGVAFGSTRLLPDSIDRAYVRATSISCLAQANATAVYLVCGRF